MSKNVDELLKEIDSKENKTDKQSVGKVVKSIASLAISLFLIMSFIISAYRIPTGSMEKTLRIGDMLLVNKFIYGFRTPDWIGIPFTNFGFSIPYYKFPQFKKIKQGDIVVFKAPADPNMNYVKRCVALPGQTVQVIDKVLYVDGKLFEDYYNQLEVDPAFVEGKGRSYNTDDRLIFPQGGLQDDIFQGLGSRDNFGPITVPEGNYFMMGDNRDWSLDSRYWGFLPKENVIGKPIMVYFSYDSEIPFSKLFSGIRWERIGYFIQ